jgi:hypothetical protein
MNRIVFWGLLVMGCASTSRILAYNTDHGPFPDDAGIRRIPLKEMARQNGGKTNGSEMVFRFGVPADPEPEVVVYSVEAGIQVELVVSNRTVFPKTLFSEFSFDYEYQVQVKMSDLNGDGRRDFMVLSGSGGCGLANGYYNIAFLLSCTEGYRLTTIQTVFPDPGDWVVLSGKPCFIQTAFDREEKCTDGKAHNFWIYNIIVIEGAAMRVDNSLEPGFPRTIWYSFRPNHAETTLLTDKQKAKLLQRVDKEIVHSLPQAMRE